MAAVIRRVKDRKRENKRHGERSNGRERAIGEVGCVNVYKIFRAEGGKTEMDRRHKNRCVKSTGRERKTEVHEKRGKRGWGEK